MHVAKDFPPEYTGIYDYCFRRLKLSEAQSEYFKRVALKSIEVPALKAAIDEGKLTLSQARRIVPVVSSANSQQWIRSAETLKQKELERAVAAENPKSLVRETLKPIAAERTELRLGISSALEKKLRRLQNLLGGSLEEALDKAATEYLERHNPIQRAQRAFLRKPTNAGLRNVVHYKDGGKCSHPGCDSERFLHIHHIKPRAQCGRDTIDNLTLLCAAHHRNHHRADPLKAPS